MSQDPAKARFFIIQIVRIGGVILALLGLTVLAGKLALPQAAGYVLVALGLFEALFAPILLTRAWKTPRP